MRLEEFDYDLPPELIAQEPLAGREDSRLLVVRRGSGALEDRSFRDLPAYVRPGDVLVVNDARVLKARLHGHREPGGGRVEALLVTPRGGGLWEAMVRPGRRIRPGVTLRFGAGARALVEGVTEEGHRLLRFASESAARDAMAAFGELPLPPYVRDPGRVDGERYQTVYAARGQAVAAPTAGLHFSLGLLETLRAAGVQTVAVTLDVGPGTFVPLRHEVVEDNRLHRERYAVTAEASAAVALALQEGRRIVAVGTTSLRVLESVGPLGFGAGALEGSTELFLRPGVPVRVAGALVTNFHLPRTSLLCLVAAVAGLDTVRAAYRHAVAGRYRFYSFGDAMLVID